MIGWGHVPALRPGRKRGGPTSYPRATCRRGRLWRPWSPQCVPPATIVTQERELVDKGMFNEYRDASKAQAVGGTGRGADRRSGAVTTHQRYLLQQAVYTICNSSISPQCTHEKGEGVAGRI